MSTLVDVVLPASLKNYGAESQDRVQFWGNTQLLLPWRVEGPLLSAGPRDLSLELTHTLGGL